MIKISDNFPVTLLTDTAFLSVRRYVCLSACLPVCRSPSVFGCLSVRHTFMSSAFSPCLSGCHSVCHSVYLFVWLSVCLSFYLTVFLSFFVPFCPSVCMSFSLAVVLYPWRISVIYLSVYLSVWVSVWFCVCLYAVCLSSCLFPCLLTQSLVPNTFAWYCLFVSSTIWWSICLSTKLFVWSAASLFLSAYVTGRHAPAIYFSFVWLSHGCLSVISSWFYLVVLFSLSVTSWVIVPFQCLNVCLS